jgi:peptide/nickel transport system substrate-binding protein
MRLMRSASLALASCVVFTAAALAAARPHYGGVLQVQVRAQLAKLESSDAYENWQSAVVREELVRLVYDRLTQVDEAGRVRPQLAVAWEHSPDYKRWTFNIRRNVELHDGSALTAQDVATALADSNRDWHVHAAGDSVIIEVDAAIVQLPELLATNRNSIIVRRMNSSVGSGPFRLDTWQSGRLATFVAHDQCWQGRPFLDGIQVQMGLGFPEQLLQLESRKADITEVALDQPRQSSSSGARVETSSPQDVYLLVLSSNANKDPRLKEALSASIDRPAIESALLQKKGTAAGSLLPQWISGYASLFSTARDLERAQQLRRDLGSAPVLNVAYDISDPLARTIAERIALNARDAGLTLRPYVGDASQRGTAELRLVRVSLLSANPIIDIENFANQAAASPLPSLTKEASEQQLYEQESAILKAQPVIPIVHVPRLTGIGTRVRNWISGRDGLWRLENVWLDTRTSQQPDSSIAGGKMRP